LLLQGYHKKSIKHRNKVQQVSQKVTTFILNTESYNQHQDLI